MKRTRSSTITYWALAVLFGLFLIWAAIWLLVDFQEMHWRYTLWWAAIVGTHLWRTPIVILIWVAFLFDLAEPMMLFLYATQAMAGPFLIAPFLILASMIYLWRRDQYNKLTPSKGDPNGEL